MAKRTFWPPWFLPLVLLFNLTMVVLTAATLSHGAGAGDDGLMSKQGVKKGLLEAQEDGSQKHPSIGIKGDHREFSRFQLC